MITAILLLSTQTAPLDADWIERFTLAADRLTLAAVEASGQTRDLEELWVSGETEQVLELLNGRACIVSSRTATGGLTCAAGGPLPDGNLETAGFHNDRGRRLDRLRGGGQAFLLTGIQGTEWRLLAWIDASRGVVLGPGVSTAQPDQPLILSPEPAAATGLPWWFWPLCLGLVMLGMIWGRRHRRGFSQEEMDAHIEAERQRAHDLVHAMDRLFETQAALAKGIERGDVLPEPSRWGHQQVGEAMNALFGRWRDAAQEVGESLERLLEGSEPRDRELEIEHWLDEKLAPLSQLGTLLSQLAIVMEQQGEMRRSRQLRARRAGLLRYVDTLRMEILTLQLEGSQAVTRHRNLALLSDSVDQLLRQVGGRIEELDGEESKIPVLSDLRRRLLPFDQTESQPADERRSTARRM
ncbi:MAG: hypothetical protein CMH55_04295 [Myxococcales bacterium]|nr:hypothetical protein [Myxococcales bacterium]